MIVVTSKKRENKNQIKKPTQEITERERERDRDRDRERERERERIHCLPVPKTFNKINK